MRAFVTKKIGGARRRRDLIISHRDLGLSEERSVMRNIRKSGFLRPEAF
jgi:hypothetical protein